MPARIRIPKDKEELVDKLVFSGETTGPFGLQADVLAFAAACGASKNKWVPFSEATNAPIRQEVFSTRGFDTLIYLLAVQRSDDPLVLADTEEADKRRVEAFEGYANGGLELLREALKGAVDYQDAIVLHVLVPAREGAKVVEDTELDIGKILH